MQPTRRTLLKTTTALGILLAAGVITSRQALAATRSAGFEAKSLPDALAALGGTAVESKDLTIVSPDIAENGAVVPVGVTCNLPNVNQIYVFIEKNPNPLAAIFMIPEGTSASVSTRVKMGQSTNVLVVAKTADGQLLSATKETKVTLGGCGG